MQKTILTLSLCLFITSLFIGIVFAATKMIEAKEGGTIKIRDGVYFVIPPGALEKDTKITANMSSRQIEQQGIGRKQLVFTFEPSGTIFDPEKPAELHIDKKFFEEENADDIVICEDSGEEEIPVVNKDNPDELIIYIDHFSSYYYPRR
jgi:hypothetical protein